MKKYTINQDVKLNNKLIEDYYEQMSVGDQLIIKRSKKGVDYETYGTRLRAAGFAHITIHRAKKGKECCISCIKAVKEDMLLSVIVPLYNEENTAGELLNKLIHRKWTMPVEFVIVESNSKDNTRNIAKAYEYLDNVTLVLEDEPHGKGNGVLEGIKHAKGNVIAIQDGDLEYDVEDYDKLLEPIINRKALFVLGSRYKKDDWHMRKFSGFGALIADYLNIGQVFLTWLLNTACGCKLTDPFTMYKIFDRDCMYGIDFVGGNFGLDWEIVIRFVRKGYKPYELPISYTARSYDEGKHIDLIGTPIEGIKALWKSRVKAPVLDYIEESVE